MTLGVLKSLGMMNYRVRLGFRDPDADKYVGGNIFWHGASTSPDTFSGEVWIFPGGIE